MCMCQVILLPKQYTPFCQFNSEKPVTYVHLIGTHTHTYLDLEHILQTRTQTTVTHQAKQIQMAFSTLLHTSLTQTHIFLHFSIQLKRKSTLKTTHLFPCSLNQAPADCSFRAALSSVLVLWILSLENKWGSYTKYPNFFAKMPLHL